MGQLCGNTMNRNYQDQKNRIKLEDPVFRTRQVIYTRYKNTQKIGVFNLFPPEFTIKNEFGKIKI